jgi:hypothetical protein
MEAVMFGDGDDTGHCSNGLTAQKYREATTEERATYRKWMRGIVAFYCALLLVAGIAIAGYSKAGLTQLTNLSARNVATSPRVN